MSDFFWKYEVTCNAACHATRGVGPATDYGVPWGTPIHAPFAGEAKSYWTDEGGWGIEIVGDEYIFRGQHLAEKPASGNVEWRQVCAKSGNTGSATTGPHIHAYIIIRATGERVSFQKWYEDIIHGGSDNARTYTVERGDTVWGIGQKLGVDYHAILDANSLDGNGLIHPGDVLVIP